MGTYEVDVTGEPELRIEFGTGVTIAGTGPVWADDDDATYVRCGAIHHPFLSQSVASVVRAAIPAIPGSVAAQSGLTMGYRIRAMTGGSEPAPAGRQLSMTVADSIAFSGDSVTYTESFDDPTVDMSTGLVPEGVITDLEQAPYRAVPGDLAALLAAGTGALFFLGAGLAPFSLTDVSEGYLYEATLLFAWPTLEIPPRRQYPRPNHRAYPPPPTAQWGRRSGSAAIL